MAEIGFMLIGLGFFVWVIMTVARDEDKLYQRRLNEAREFGFGGPNQHTIKTLKDR